MAASSSASTVRTSLVEPAPYTPLEPLPLKDQGFENAAPNVSKPEELGVVQPSVNATASRPEQSLWRASLIIGTLSGITLTSSMTTGLLTVALLTMATDLGLSDALLLWPASVYGLTSGCSLMIAGAIADVVGSRVVYLVGCFLLTGSILGSGLAETSTQLIGSGAAKVSRSPCAYQLRWACSLYIYRRANVEMLDSLSSVQVSRLDTHACVAFIVFVIGIFGLPKENAGAVREDKMRKVVFGIDWVDAILASASLAMLSLQRVQGVSAIQTPLYFVPNIIIGVVLSVTTGFILHRLSVYWLVLITCCLTAVAPLLMAVNDPNWSYWYASFWAVFLSPLSGGTLFVVSALIMTSTFPDNTQALAGAVFNTFSQFRTAVGLTVVAVISSSVSRSSAAGHAHSRMTADEAQYAPQNLLGGYRASFWALFGSAILTCAIGAFGLRNVSNKGMKKD
ncbi:hypothetical protein DL766_006910 [Monosporascus sp. MC13-8B]|uniref:Major facilitator superfamily (MFS) profile domain-containing protein n=1 Tax=Monosporascus cannonballus TaxID=155416 RepID=A0ABY0HCJ9_9PEZI|nr:hypothetical protein DL762_002757 [Monosporascus cannonballus]RYO99644.1 hypothetical protein DL763_001358 [Monosporascus cannonballus]RYP25817.1 hypothetical protein DL766_006910 [Monosporascus sp. MC13-8B]